MVLAVYLLFSVACFFTVHEHLLTETKIMDFLLDTEWGWLWTTLPKVMAAMLIVCAVGGELLIWRTIQRYVVR